MTTPKDKSQEGPYRVVYSEEKSAFRIEGPTPHNWNYSEKNSPKEQADQLNAAYAAGQASQPSVEQRVEEIMAAHEEVVDDWIIDPDFGVMYNDGAFRELRLRFRARLTDLLSKP